MIFVGESTVTCRKCGTPWKIEWDLDWVDSYEKEMGINSTYESERTIICDKCGECFSATLWVSEYPEGVLEEATATVYYDEEERSIDPPKVEFFDL